MTFYYRYLLLHNNYRRSLDPLISQWQHCGGINCRSPKIIKIKIKNSGSVTSTGYGDYDYRPFFEVSDVSSTAQNVVGILDGDTPIYVKDGDSIKTYYAKSDGDWSNITIQNL